MLEVSISHLTSLGFVKGRLKHDPRSGSSYTTSLVVQRTKHSDNLTCFGCRTLLVLRVFIVGYFGLVTQTSLHSGCTLACLFSVGSYGGLGSYLIVSSHRLAELITWGLYIHTDNYGTWESIHNSIGFANRTSLQ